MPSVLTINPVVSRHWIMTVVNWEYLCYMWVKKTPILSQCGHYLCAK